MRPPPSIEERGRQPQILAVHEQVAVDERVGHREVGRRGDHRHARDRRRSRAPRPSAAGGSGRWRARATPARSSASRPRASASTAARPAASVADQNSSSAGLPASAGERARLVPRDRAPRTPAPGTARRARCCPADRPGRRRRPVRSAAPRWPGRAPPTRGVHPRSGARGVSSVASVNVCTAPDGHVTVTRPDAACSSPSPTISVFECCDRKPEPAATMLRLLHPVGLDHDARADRVAVALARSGEPQRERAAARAEVVAEEAQLRRLPRRHDRRGPDRRRDRRRAPRTIGRPARGRGRPCPTRRRSRPCRRCGAARCAAGWRSTRGSATG